MKKSLSLLSLLLLVTACSSTVEEPIADVIKVDDSSQIYASFTLNTQEFLEPEMSLDVINGVLDLHEEYEVPLDIFFEDFLVQELDETEIFDELSENELVAISYHVRPPLPYAGGYNEIDWIAMDDQEIYETYLEYESFTMDPISGELTDEPGGYSYLSKLIGYSPYAAALGAPDDHLVEVYSGLGAQFAVSHMKSSYTLGDKIGDLYFRPETKEIRLFNTSIEEVQTQIDEALSLPNKNPVFINFKLHDKDFFADSSAWSEVYLKKTSPYSFKNYYEDVYFLTEEEKKEVWSIYEYALDYVASHDEFQALNLEGVSEIIAL